MQIQYTQSVWQHSYGVDGQMDPLPCHYYHIWWPRFENAAEILGHFWASHHTIEVWLRLLTHIVWFSHPQKHITKLFDNFHMMLMGRTIHHHATATTHDDPDLRVQLKSWVTSGHQTIPLSGGSGCRSTWHGSHIHFKHNQGVWQHSYDANGQKDHHHANTTTHDGADLGNHLKSWVAAKNKAYHCAAVEAPDPPGMVPKSTMNITMVMDNLDRVWMIRWIHHHTVTAAAVGTDPDLSGMNAFDNINMTWMFR